MSMIETSDVERRIAAKIDPGVTTSMALTTNRTGGLVFANMSEVMEFSKAMSVSSVGVRKHLRGNVGACLAVTMQAIEWEMSPFAVANKSYLVNDQIAYEAQLLNAVILKRAPIKGRFKVEYRGEGGKRQCKVWVKLDEEGETVEYESPETSGIKPKNSPLWTSDPDQQLFYYSSRALCRRHFPDVLLGVYEVEELGGSAEHAVSHTGPRDVTPRMSSADKLDALVGPTTTVSEVDYVAASSEGRLNGIPHDAETGEIIDNQSSGGEPEATTERGEPATVVKSAEAGAPTAASAPKAEKPVKSAKDMTAAERNAKILADITPEGNRRAADGTSSLEEFLDGLNGDEQALLSIGVVNTWRATAKAADAAGR